jgi:transposase
MRLRERLGSIFEDEQFRALSPRRGQGAQAPWQLALVTLVQFVDGLTDRQAAEELPQSNIIIVWERDECVKLGCPALALAVASFLLL